MKNLVLMSMMHTARDIDHESGDSLVVSAVQVKLLIETAPADELHCQVGTAVVVEDIEDLDDVRVFHGRHAFGLEPEASSVLIRHRVRRAELDCDPSLQRAVEGLVYDTHTTLPEQLNFPVSLELRQLRSDRAEARSKVVLVLEMRFEHVAGMRMITQVAGAQRVELG
jgi:hypothetical protein